VITIRPVEPNEYEAVGELVVAAYRTVPDADANASYEPALRDVARRAQTATVLVAELDGRVVGTATYVNGPSPDEEIQDPDAASIRMVGVVPEARRRGVARALIEACIAEARARGRARIRLATRTTMPEAQRLYEGLGFGREPGDDWRPNEHLHLIGYVLELSDTLGA
jgi:ribosomal protein S18 acetylase RimI-like enzyme